MGADIKQLKNRIRSVDSTMHLTKAMGLVATSKMRKSNQMMTAGREYSDSFREAVRLLCGSRECAKSAYLREAGSRVRAIVIAGDRGMAGGYNANVFRIADAYRGHIIPLGKRACARYGGEYISSEKIGTESILNLVQIQCADFVRGEFDRLIVVCTKYISMMTQEAVIEELLPLKKSEEVTAAPIFEPDEVQVLEAAVPQFLAGELTRMIRESFACEIAARRTAMDSAGRNAQLMIDQLQIQYNRARQNAITQEITEIVAGAGQ